MTEETDSRVKEAVPGDDRQGPVGGERLAAARRAQQITVLEIAKELHLDEPKVRALERNDFDVLGAPVFAKGHLRKYAQLVAVDEADVMLDYYQLNRSAGMPQVVSTRPKLRREISFGPWIAVLSVIVIVGAIYWWFFSGAEATERPVTGEITSLPQESAVGASNENDAPDEPNIIGRLELQTALLVAEIGEPGNAAGDAPIAAGLRMTLSYAGDCWTEITDANGRRLFFDLGTSGRRVVLSGEAPFNVLFGNADNVSIQVNGLPFTIPVADRSGLTARLTISGS